MRNTQKNIGISFSTVKIKLQVMEWLNNAPLKNPPHPFMRCLLIILVTSSCILRHVSAEAVYPQFFERQAKINGKGCVDFRWTYDKEARDIVFSARSDPGASWLGIGISESGSMKGADIVMVQWDELDGEFSHFDKFSHDFVLPQDDILQNYELLHAVKDDEDRIHAVIRRAADTCDMEDMPITGTKQNLICASGDTDSSGSPLYHGMQRGGTQTNLVIDEDILYSRNLHLPLDANATEIVPGLITTYEDHEAATSMFPVDFHMPTLPFADANERTIYGCVVFTMPFEMRAVSVQSVWGDGETEDHNDPPIWLHHQTMQYCDEPDKMLTQAQLSGDAYDCYKDQPLCTTQLVVGQSGFAEMPTAAHLPLKQGGTYILQIHYDNRFGLDLSDEKPGIRVWVEPPSEKAVSLPGKLHFFRAHPDSIVIPPDPEQKEFEIQTLISSEATIAVLSETGAQAFSSLVHMHETGIRATVKLIRDGVHIRNVYESNGFDFALQTSKIDLWRLMPGDALVISCFYKPDPKRHIKGGWSSDDEMCDFVFLTVGSSGDLENIVGWSVRPDQDFEWSYTGSSVLDVPRDAFNFAPNPKRRNYIALEDHRLNVCDALVRHEFDLSSYTWEDPAIAAQTYFMASFFALHMTRYLLSRLKLSNIDERKRRNTSIYIVQLVYSLFTLPIILHALANIFLASSSFDAVDPQKWSLARSLIVGQSILFLTELSYRIDIRVELVLHHLLASGLVIFLNWVGYEFLAVEITFKLGCVLTLFAVTEQFNYLYLILRNLGYGEQKWCEILGYFSGWFYIVTKLAIGCISFYLMDQLHNESEKSFDIKENSYGDWMSSDTNPQVLKNIVVSLTAVMVSVLIIVQIYVGLIFLKLSTAKRDLKRSKSTKKVVHMDSEVAGSEL